MPDSTPFEIAHRRLKLLGVAIERLPGEYKVNVIGGKEGAWEAFETFPEAEARGDQLAALEPVARPTGGRRRRRGKPIYRSPKAYLKAMRRRHNKRLWATLGKVVPSTPPR